MAETQHLLTPAQEAFLRKHLTGFDPTRWAVTEAGQAGSDRRFIRISAPGQPSESRVLVVWDSRDPDWPRFLGVVDELGPHTPALPRISGYDTEHGLILEEDLGTATLHVSCAGADAQTVARLYRTVVEQLAAWHRLDPKLSPTISSRAMDRETFLWESAYFATHCVTEYCGCERMLETPWEKERAELADACAALPRVCMHRDFQSENVMLTEGGVRFVDFQGARLGPAHYDLASLLYDPYASYLEGEMVGELYRDYVRAGGTDDPRAFRVCAVQRLMQALGAYGNLGLHKNKERYLAYIPLALRRLKGVLDGCGEYPVIRDAVTGCLEKCSGRRQGKGA